MQLYPRETKKELAASGSRYVTQAWFEQPARQLLEGMSGVSSNAYQYQFALPVRNNPAAGSPHAMELQYVFGTLPSGADKKAHEVSQTMIRYWAQFAKAGDPNTDGLIHWPAYGTSKQFLRIDEKCEVGAGLAKEACDALDNAVRQR